ncbi:hypothetical protein LAD12857_40270 [Lacrimispora amygdalina]|uniref:Pilus assembly protein n=1 Tax=Lacrimispora amygdalina TaxID=253257 RepID=A0A3E2N7R8_9FIRM|nr:hypothetical protein [Clostridium indicum]RFZ77026.1 hypothetical protein DS742_20525 [Clostridium indicum]
MPFFREFIKIIRKAKVTLQVQIPLIRRKISAKRVLSSASLKEGSASLTIEAALALPLFLFAVIILMMPMKLLNDGRKVQTALEITGEELSQYVSVLKELEKREDLSAAGVNELPDGFLNGMTEQGILLYARMKMSRHDVFEYLDSVSFSHSSILKDNETIDLIMDYRIRLPFAVLGLKSIKMTARCCRRAWIGNTLLYNEESDHSQELVYVGRDSTRYHKKRTCHYLYNHIKAVNKKDLESMRNINGGKYKPCSRCTGLTEEGSVVYIMPSGEKYHSNKDCTAITAYVRLVPLSEVVHLGACSYCSQ